jgi:hypothetical protein
MVKHFISLYSNLKYTKNGTQKNNFNKGHNSFPVHELCIGSQ